MKREMTDYTRGLIFQVVDGQPNLLHIVHMWTSFVRFDEILLWCVRNKMTGTNLLAWLHGEFQGLPRTMAKAILMKVDKEKIGQPILLQTDFISRH